MKKSTLITTIAMIVVVVVALSTATYAWFSSASTITATTTFQTEAGADWTLVVGQKGQNNVYSLTGAAVTSDPITLGEGTLGKGLWAPLSNVVETVEQGISGKMSSSSVTQVTVTPHNFVSATESAGVYTATGADPTSFDPIRVYKVTNTTDTAKNLQLDIYIFGDDTTVKNVRYAMASWSFAIEYAIGTGAAANVHTNYATSSTIAETTHVITKANDVAYSAAAYERPAYNTAQSAGFTAVPASVPTGTTMTASTGVYKLYTITISNVPAYGFCNVAIWAWMDGFTAESGASSAEFSANFVFSTGAQNP